MEICVHRGAEEIGGSCIEIAYEGARLFLDAGRNLDAGLPEFEPLPEVRAFGLEALAVVGVVVSHGHPDHYGLVPGLPPDIPIYTGRATQRILREAAFFSPSGADLQVAAYLRDQEQMSIGPFVVTPYLIDHSAFDSYALLVEAGGRRIFYSGDMRSHGRKGETFERLLESPPEDIDLLVLEGTYIRPGPAASPPLSEQEVEESCVDVFRNTQGIVLACYSGQNIDRVVTMHRAARRAGRTLVLDLYGAEVARATGRSRTIPQGDWNSVLVYIPRSQRALLRRTREFDRAERVRRRRIFPERLETQASKLVLTFRKSMTDEIEAAGCLHGASAVWSMWPGYLEQPQGRDLAEWFAARGIPLTFLHSSGHADASDLQRFAGAMRAREVTPVHTLHAELFAGLFDNVRVRRNGERWSL